MISVSTSGYAHDLASFPIKDARKSTQCVNAGSRPACQILTDFNETSVDIWDVSDPSSRQLLATQTYPNVGYTHSGWWTEDGRFLFRSDENGFEEAMVYFHVDRAIRYLERLGFRDERAIFRAPVAVNVRGTNDDQSWYSPGSRQLFFGLGGGVNDAEDAETILHEFGHALQDAICPDFGQSKQAAAMGEGFGDYLALTFFADKRPARYRSCVMTWDGITWSENDPPCVRNLSTGRGFESFDWESQDAEHTNGLIWGETLWTIWNAVGKPVADRIIVESHFQLDGYASFAKAARAIIDADRNLFEGRHVAALRQIFRRRGIGPVE